MGIEAENKKFPSNDITNPKIYAMLMYKYETGYGIHIFEDRMRGLRSRTSVVDVVVRRRRRRGRVVEQLDDDNADVRTVSPNSHDDECQSPERKLAPRGSTG